MCRTTSKTSFTNIIISGHNYIFQCFYIINQSNFKTFPTCSIHLKSLLFHADKRDFQGHFIVFHIQCKLTFNIGRSTRTSTFHNNTSSRYRLSIRIDNHTTDTIFSLFRLHLANDNNTILHHIIKPLRIQNQLKSHFPSFIFCINRYRRNSLKHL